MILNSKLQIVFINECLLKLLGLTDSGEILGVRVGEVLSCTNSDELPGGCGRTEFCGKCGFTKAIFKALDGAQATEECRIRTHNNKALDIRVLATPYKIKDEYFLFIYG